MTDCANEKYTILREALRLWMLLENLDALTVKLGDEDLTRLQEFRSLIHLHWSHDISFDVKLNNSVKHILRYIDLDDSQVLGTTYKSLRNIVSSLGGHSSSSSRVGESLAQDDDHGETTMLLKLEPVDCTELISTDGSSLLQLDRTNLTQSNGLEVECVSGHFTTDCDYLSTSRGPASKRYACNECGGKEFANKGSLDRHRRQHTGERPFSCTFCSKTFVSASNCSKHVRRRHTPASERQTISCSVCSKLFSDRTYLQEHVKQHHGMISPGDIDIGDDSVQTTPLSFGGSRSENNKRGFPPSVQPSIGFVCAMCNREFPYRSSLKEHMRIHTEERAFQCELCGKSFKRAGDLTVHSRFHDRQKRFTCTDCGQTFTWKNGLVRHRRIHTGEKPYLCNTCGRSFAGYSNHRKHMKVHAREAAASSNSAG